MISREIEFSAPTTLDGVLNVLAEYEYDVTVLSGGMSLLPMMNLGLATPDRVVSLNRVDGLAVVSDEGSEVVIGARARHAQLAADPVIARFCPAIEAAASRIGDVQVRNRAPSAAALRTPTRRLILAGARRLCGQSGESASGGRRLGTSGLLHRPDVHCSRTVRADHPYPSAEASGRVWIGVHPLRPGWKAVSPL